MSETILVAIIAAIPATIAAYASLKNKQKSDKQMTPSNGHTLIQMIEDIWGEIAVGKAERARLDEEDQTLRQQLSDHDNRLMGVAEDLHRDHKGNEGDFAHICPFCLQIIGEGSPRDEGRSLHGEE